MLMLCTSVGKNLKNVALILTSKFEVFWGFSSKKPQTQNLKKTSKLDPQPQNCCPQPHLEFWGFSRVKPQKTSKKFQPSASKNLKIFWKLKPQPQKTSNFEAEMRILVYWGLICPPYWNPFSLQDEEKIDTLYFWQFLAIPKFLLDDHP